MLVKYLLGMLVSATPWKLVDIPPPLSISGIGILGIKLDWRDKVSVRATLWIWQARQALRFLVWTCVLNRWCMYTIENSIWLDWYSANACKLILQIDMQISIYQTVPFALDVFPRFLKKGHAWWTNIYFSEASVLRLLLQVILRSTPEAVFSFGLVCSTWVSVSRGSTFRHFFLPLGDQSAASVKLGNLLAARTKFGKKQPQHIYSIYVPAFILQIKHFY